MDKSMFDIEPKRFIPWIIFYTIMFITGLLMWII